MVLGFPILARRQSFLCARLLQWGNQRKGLGLRLSAVTDHYSPAHRGSHSPLPLALLSTHKGDERLPGSSSKKHIVRHIPIAWAKDRLVCGVNGYLNHLSVGLAPAAVACETWTSELALWEFPETTLRERESWYAGFPSYWNRSLQGCVRLGWGYWMVKTSAEKGFPGGSDGKESPCSAGDLGSISGSGRSSGEGHGNPLKYSCVEDPRGQRSLAGYSPRGSQRVRHDWAALHSAEKSEAWPFRGPHQLVTQNEGAQTCPTLPPPMSCSLPGSSVHGILQARRLEWDAIPSSRGSSQPRDWSHFYISCR